MSGWLQSQLKAAGDLLEAVDRTAQKVSTTRTDQPLAGPASIGSSAGTTAWSSFMKAFSQARGFAGELSVH
jgi:hypothetical protein